MVVGYPWEGRRGVRARVREGEGKARRANPNMGSRVSCCSGADASSEKPTPPATRRPRGCTASRRTPRTTRATSSRNPSTRRRVPRDPSESDPAPMPTRTKTRKRITRLKRFSTRGRGASTTAARSCRRGSGECHVCRPLRGPRGAESRATTFARQLGRMTLWAGPGEGRARRTTVMMSQQARAAAPGAAATRGSRRVRLKAADPRSLLLLPLRPSPSRRTTASSRCTRAASGGGGGGERRGGAVDGDDAGGAKMSDQATDARRDDAGVPAAAAAARRRGPGGRAAASVRVPEFGPGGDVRRGRFGRGRDVCWSSRRDGRRRRRRRRAAAAVHVWVGGDAAAPGTRRRAGAWGRSARRGSGWGGVTGVHVEFEGAESAEFWGRLRGGAGVGDTTLLYRYTLFFM